MKTFDQQLELIQENLKLNKKQSHICYLISVGMSNKEVAKTLKISLRELDNALKSIFQTTSIVSRAKLMIKCLPYLEFYQMEEST